MNYYEQKSERLTYRALNVADIPDWEQFFHNNDRLHFVGMQDKGTPSQMSEYWINKQLARYKANQFGLLAAVEKISGKVVGQVGILIRDDLGEGREYEIAYSLKPEYWGRGFGTEMAQALKKYGFENQVSNRYISTIHKENEASINVAKKNGMKLLYEIFYHNMDMFVYGIEL